jgi:hypothetical protein
MSDKRNDAKKAVSRRGEKTFILMRLANRYIHRAGERTPS